MSSLGQLHQGSSPPEAWQGVIWQSSTKFVEAGTVCHPAVMRFASLSVTHQNFSPYCLVSCAVPFLSKQFRMEQGSLWVQTSCFLWRITHLTHRFTSVKAHRPRICLCSVLEMFFFCSRCVWAVCVSWHNFVAEASLSTGWTFAFVDIFKKRRLHFNSSRCRI